MRKIFALFISVIIFTFCFYSLYAEKSPVFKSYASEYELYLTAGSFGDNIAYATDKDFKDYTKIKGESCFVAVSYEQVLKDFAATHIYSEETAEGTSYYAYSPRIKYKVCIDGEAVNIHYFAGKTHVKLGTPIIFGSF